MSATTSCIIVDDEPLAIRLLKAHIKQIPQLELIESFEQPLMALQFLREHSVDLIFLDIQMPTLTGMDFARTLGGRTPVIFTTAYRDYAVESYELQVLDYLVKPITFPRFYQAVDNFLQSRPETSAPEKVANNNLPTAAAFRYFNVNKKHIKVALSDITYIESRKEYIIINTADQQLQTKEKISAFIKSLPQNFIRVHRSFIVNTDHITAFTNQDIEIKEKEIPIGLSYKMTVLKALK